MNTGEIPKDLLYGELSEGLRSVGRPIDRVCKLRSSLFKSASATWSSAAWIATWEDFADDRTSWHTTVRSGVLEAGESRKTAIASKISMREDQ